MELTSDMLGIRRKHFNQATREYNSNQDIILYLRPNQVENIKARLLLSPKLHWCGRAIVDITKFELTPGQLVGEIMLGVQLGDFHISNATVHIRLTKRMLDGDERFVETEVQLRGSK